MSIPSLKLEVAEALAEKFFGIIATARILPSERDQNFLLTTPVGEHFILKVANSQEDQSLLEAQNALLSHLESRVRFCPRLVSTTSGEKLAKAESNFVRLVTYLPGLPLAVTNPHTPALLRDLGSKLGQLDRTLADFDHPALHRDFHWDLANGWRVIHDHGELIRDHRLRALVLSCGEELERELDELIPRLRRSVIHGDANDYNVLAGDDEIVGLIDFGDSNYSYTVGDLSVALAYVVVNKADPVSVAMEVVRGYVQEYALDENELSALWRLMLMRLCMSVCLAAYQTRQRPENEYLEISQQMIRDGLPRLAKIDRRAVVDRLRQVS